MTGRRPAFGADPFHGAAGSLLLRACFDPMVYALNRQMGRNTLPRTVVDLPIFLQNDVRSDPPASAPKTEYFMHEKAFAPIEPFFPGLDKQDPPGGKGWAVELVQLSTHNGAPLDAPCHFDSTMNRARGEKERVAAVHEVPLEWCFQPGVKLDFRHVANGCVVTAADVEAELNRIGGVNTRAGSRCVSPDHLSSGWGVGFEATMYLLEAA